VAVDRKACKHAFAWILYNRGVKIEDFVHEYYSVARFKATYEDRIEPIPDRSQWPVVELGFKVFPPLLGRGAGRPKIQRHRGCLEKMASKKKTKGYVMSPLKCRKQAPINIAGPSQDKKQKV